MSERVAIVGSRPPKKSHPTIGPLTRDWDAHYRRVDATWQYVFALPQTAIVVSGGARGIDVEAERAAKVRTPRLTVMVFYPNWERGKGAGIARNRQIVHNCDRVVAVWDGKSRGTKDTIDFARSVGRPVEVIEIGETP